jgi:hypothetical protein
VHWMFRPRTKRGGCRGSAEGACAEMAASVLHSVGISQALRGRDLSPVGFNN